MVRYVLTVRFVEDEDSEFGLDYLEEAIDQAGGNIVNIEQD